MNAPAVHVSVSTGAAGIQCDLIFADQPIFTLTLCQRSELSGMKYMAKFGRLLAVLAVCGALSYLVRYVGLVTLAVALGYYYNVRYHLTDYIWYTTQRQVRKCCGPCPVVGIATNRLEGWQPTEWGGNQQNGGWRGDRLTDWGW